MVKGYVKFVNHDMGMMSVTGPEDHLSSRCLTNVFFTFARPNISNAFIKVV